MGHGPLSLSNFTSISVLNIFYFFLNSHVVFHITLILLCLVPVSSSRFQKLSCLVQFQQCHSIMRGSGNLLEFLRFEESKTEDKMKH